MKMKRPLLSTATTLCAAAAALQCSLPSASAFGLGAGDLHTHAAPFLAHPSLLHDSVSTVVSSAAAVNPAQQAVSDLFSKYLATLGSYPLPTKMLTGAALATAGDAIAQSREDDDYSPARGASFAAFDSIYRASQHFLFPIIVDLCRGQFLLGALAAVGAANLVDVSQLTAMERSLASQLIIVPFLYYPVFFTFTGFMQGLTFEQGVERAKENFLPLMERNLLFWIPVQFVQFGYVPTDLQIPFLSCAGLAWTFILSLMAGSATKYSSDNPEHETYCITGTEEGCIIPEEELFPECFHMNDDGDCEISAVYQTETNGSTMDANGATTVEVTTEEERREVAMK